MTNVLLYSRVATIETPSSISFQEESMISYCNKKKYNIIKSYHEVGSGKTFNRQEWNSLKSYLKFNRGSINKILVLRFNRFSRNHYEALKEIESLKKINVEVEVVENLTQITEQGQLNLYYKTLTTLIDLS